MAKMPGLSAKQQRFAELVASGLSQTKAAQSVGVSPRQARKWLADNPALRERINELSAEIASKAVQHLTASLLRAAKTLRKLMTSSYPAQIQLAAARGTIADFVALRQFTDLAARVEALEAEAKQRMETGNGSIRPQGADCCARASAIRETKAG